MLKSPHSIYIFTGEYFIDFVYKNCHRTVPTSSKVFKKIYPSLDILQCKQVYKSFLSLHVKKMLRWCIQAEFEVLVCYIISFAVYFQIHIFPNVWRQIVLKIFLGYLNISKYFRTWRSGYLFKMYLDVIVWE